MPNLYITPAEIKDSIPDLIQAATTKYDDALLRYAGRLSRFIDQHCERVFFPTSELRAFTGKGGRVMRIPDVLSISQLRYSEDDGATYTALTQSGNWHLARSGDFAHPGSYDQIVIDPNGTSLGSWSSGLKAIELTGIWAYADDRDDCWEDSLDEVEDNPLTAAATEVTVNNADGAGAFGPIPRFMAGMLARDVAKTTRALAPVGETGQLRAGVDHELLVGSSIGEISGRVVDRTYYALWVEFGTAYPSSVRAIATTLSGTRKAAVRVARTRAAKRTAGRHFMYRAFIATRGRVMDHFGRALDDLTAELGGRGAH